MTEIIEVISKRIEYVGECPVCHTKQQSRNENMVNSLCASCRNKGHLQSDVLELIGATITECMIDSDHNIFALKTHKDGKHGTIQTQDGCDYIIGGFND